jgi:hypothetical protein
VGGDWLLVELRDLDMVRIDRTVGTLDHLVEHVRGREVVPWRISIAMVFGQKITPLANGNATLRDEQRFIYSLS